MAPVVIDLTSSPEPEETPGKAARSALDSFRPRSQKADLPKPKKDEQKHSAARLAFEHVESRKDREPADSHGKTARQSLSARSPGAPLQGYEKQSNGVSANGYGLPPKRTHDALQGSRAGYHAHPPNGRRLPIPLDQPKSNVQPIQRLKSSEAPNKPLATHRAPPVPKVNKAPEFISIDDDSDATGSSSESLLPIDAIFEAELHGLRPSKKRRINDPAEDLRSRGTEPISDTQKRSIIAGRSSNGLIDAVPLANTSTNGLPIRPTPPLGYGQQTGAQLDGDRGGSEQITALRDQSLRIGLPFNAGRTSNGSISDPPRSRSERLSESNFLTSESTRARAERDSRTGEGQAEPLRMQHSHATEKGPVSKNASMNMSASEGPQNQSEQQSVSSLSSHLSYDSSRSGTESSSKDGQEDVKLRKMQLHRHTGTNTPTAKRFGPIMAAATRKLLPYTQAEDDLLIKLRKHDNLNWTDILPHFPERTMGSISGHYSTLRARSQGQQPDQHKSQHGPSGPAKSSTLYSKAEDDLLIKLRDIDKLDWQNILPHFPGRAPGSIAGHYGQLKANASQQTPKQDNSLPRSSALAKTSTLYSNAEDDLLIKLRDVDKMDWHSILPHFPDRVMGSILGHYGQLKARASQQIPKEITAIHLSPNSSHNIPYSAKEDALLVNLKEVHNLNWDAIVSYFQGRTRGSLKVRYYTKLKSESTNQYRDVNLHPQPPSKPIFKPQQSNTNHGTSYSTEEDALIIKLRAEGLHWDQMTTHFNGRTAGSLAVRYSSKLKDKPARHSALDGDGAQQASTDDDGTTRPQRKKRHNGPSVLSGFIAWADIKKSRQRVFEDEQSAVEDEQQIQQSVNANSWHGTERAYPKSLARILRQREIGGNGRHNSVPTTRSIPDELKEHVFDDLGPRKCLQGTSGDVTCMTWAPDGGRFAAGSIAITDEQSMQYNKPCNLLLGDVHNSIVYELPEHHIQRPINTDIGNVNSLRSMRATQDQRLFMTVASVQFSPDGKTLYSAGMDGKARAYSVDSGKPASCQYELEHPTRVDLLSISNLDVLATACHQAADGCVRIYKKGIKFASLSPTRADNQTERPMYPSALKWGTSWRHTHLLLAGFSIDSLDEERNLAGETCLWDVHHEKRIEINTVTRNVFDVAWNPSPSSGSTAFAVASTPGVNKVNRGTRTVVQCFAPRQNRAAAVLEFESRAFDINDVTYCPHDDNVVAAGATDGKVYVWDQRYAKKGNEPLHVLAHDHSLNVLDHDRERELADTGVRFLSWGATSSRLYSGSSDGVVKIWNPYRSPSDAHTKDVVTFTSAVMSGALSPDYRDLLIGEDQGRINLFSIGHGNQSIRSMDRFELRQARMSNDVSLEHYDGRTVARDLLESGQIELRPMGAFSKRQAVQGPNYNGPYLTPSAQELQEAETEYQVALDLQNEEHAKAAVDPTQSSDSGQALRGADKQVQTAQEKLIRLHSRLDDSEVLTPQARAAQRQFKDAEEKHKASVASLSSTLENCTLDCNYLPVNLDEDAEVADSRRSEARIPAALRQMPATNPFDMDVDELIDAGLTHKCATCSKPAPRPKSGLPSCSLCRRKMEGITATCEICSSALRPTLEARMPNLCERCNFSCFRCGKPAFIARDAAKISCYQCELVWTAGVLGYELATTRKASEPAIGMRTIEVETISNEEMMG